MKYDMRKLKYLISSILLFLMIVKLSAQQASIREEMIQMPTYLFSDPDPVPNIGRIYPYSRFDGFTNTAIDKEWNMVILENDLIEVWVCPDIGGKVWIAKEKSTGGEFLYHNHVVKFRDVAMRGPWTSGGLEFNFGDIGHIPTCATPVDYLTKENSDGSVSCIVGAIDLPSGTKWNIEIIVCPGKAFFETKVSWFNNTEVPHTYYHWMNAAAKADGDLEFIYPGSFHIGHGGEIGDWPVKNARDISWYKNNDFGPYKSYHVINSYSNFFGGYWHDDDFGFGHMANYDDKPGKKLWIWGLSDQGMIWEDLLTDNDGQYIEFQAGKLFNQAAGSSTLTPFKHREFQAADADIMSEVWFPLKETGGMLAVSEYAVLNIDYSGKKPQLVLSALQEIKEELIIKTGETTRTLRLKLEALQLFRTEIDWSSSEELSVELGDNLLSYVCKGDSKIVDRPIGGLKTFNWESAYGIYTKALELEKQRLYTDAIEEYNRVLIKDPGFLPALSRLSLLHYRRMEYKKAIDYARQALSVDTYDPETNYIFGLINLKLENTTEALSGFSIASHSPLTKSAAYLELSKVFLREKNFASAISYAEKSTDYNRNNISAYEVAVLAGRLSGKSDFDKVSLVKINDLDPLSDFARYERVKKGEIEMSEFKSGIRNEFPYESYLDLAIKYYRFGDTESALFILKNSPENTVVDLWIAYLNNKDGSELGEILDTADPFVFPHRIETAEILREYISKNDSWILKYYLGLIYWNKGLLKEAEDLYLACGMEPQNHWFWLSKAELFADNTDIVSASLEKAYELKPESWRVVVALSELYTRGGNPGKAANMCYKLLAANSENPKLGLTYARALLEDGQYIKCLSFLEKFVLLPYEGSVDGKLMFSDVCIRLAQESILTMKYRDAINYAEKAKDWPANLGVGRPYDVDESRENFLLAYAHFLEVRHLLNLK
jgi:tetratricopeptide (TPR) repeat protein